MTSKNSVFIAASIDGYIADENGDIEWLHDIPNPDGIDMGYGNFMSQIDALVMGRATFETVCGFDIDWPYSKPVFVLSTTLTEIPEKLKDKVEILSGDCLEILKIIKSKGFNRLYIDGGRTIQNFLKEDLIDEMIITVIPVLLGGGSPLFSANKKALGFECVESKIFLGKIVQNTFRRVR